MMALAFHQRDLSDPDIREMDPEGFILEYEALECIIDYALRNKVALPGFNEGRYQRRYEVPSDTQDVYLFQDDFYAFLERHYDPKDESIDKGFREIVQHYLEGFGLPVENPGEDPGSVE